MKRLVCSTTGWGMILCLVAGVSPLLPWQVHDGFWQSGYGSESGPLINIVAALGFVFLVATSPLPPAWWRAATMAGVGGGIILLILDYAGMRWIPFGNVRFGWRDFPVREFGGLLAILSAAGLLLVAALEVRQLLLKRLADHEQQKPQA